MGQAPEALARSAVDALLRAAGWVVQDTAVFNRNAALGVAVRVFNLSTGPCDHLLFVGGKACGVIEAKKSGVTLSGVAEQAARFLSALPAPVARWDQGLVFDYESTGDETYFRGTPDPRPRSRRVFAFHQPATLQASLSEPDTLRQRLGHMPPLKAQGLRDCQVEAITALENSLAKDRARSLIQMATGAGTLQAAVRRQIEAKARTAAGIYKISQKDTAEIRFPVPDAEDEMNLAVEAVAKQSSAWRLVIEELAGREREAIALRQSILRAAFSGQLVAQDSDDESAAALLTRLAAQPSNAPPAAQRRGRPPGQAVTAA